MQDLDNFKNEMNLSGKNVYVGHRYIPKIFGEWDNTQIYEPLSIVTYQGASYTSRQYVPVGVELTNEEFWVVTGNYNAQVEQYRQDVRNLEDDLIEANAQLDTNTDTITQVSDDFNTFKDIVKTQGVNARDYGILGDNTDETVKIQQLIDENDVIIFPQPEQDYYGISDEIILPSDKKIKFIGTNNATNENPKDVTFKWLGDEAPDKAMFRASTEVVGVEPIDSIRNLRLEGGVLLSGSGKVGYGFYGAYLIMESVIKEITAISTTKVGIYLDKLWYVKIKDLVATYNEGTGISIGRNFGGGVNGVVIENLRAHTCGRNKAWSDTNVADGVGVYVKLGYGSKIIGITSEQNYGAGLVWNLGGGNTQSIDNVYLEGNGNGAYTDGKYNEYLGLIIQGGTEGRAKNIRNITFTGPIPQCMWIRGESNSTVDIYDFDATVGSKIIAENDKYNLLGSVSDNMSTNIRGHLPNLCNGTLSSAIKNVYVNNTGNENNSGRSAESAVPLSKATKMIRNLDVFTNIIIKDYTTTDMELNLLNVKRPIKVVAIENARVTRRLIVNGAHHVTISGFIRVGHYEINNSTAVIENFNGQPDDDSIRGVLNAENSNVILNGGMMNGINSTAAIKNGITSINSKVTALNTTLSNFTNDYLISLGGQIQIDKALAEGILPTFADNTGMFISESNIHLPNNVI